MGYDAKINYVTDSFRFLVYQKYLQKNMTDRIYRNRPYPGVEEDAEAVAGYAANFLKLPETFDFEPYLETLRSKITNTAPWNPSNSANYMWSFMAGYASRTRYLTEATPAISNRYLKSLSYHSVYSGNDVPPTIDTTLDTFHNYIYDGFSDSLNFLQNVEDYPAEVLVISEYHSNFFDALIWEDELKPIEGHYARLSKRFPGQVSFYESPERMAQARRLCIKPGKYLKRYYPDMDPDVIRSWAAKATNFYDMKLAKTPEEIVEVYTKGPNSCMSKSADYYSAKIHPCSVYGDSDLALAYITTGKKITARALVWPEKKIAGRIYGDYDRLIPLLKKEGYDIHDEDDPTENYHTFEGARLRLIPYGKGQIVCPYVDGVAFGVEEDGWLKLHGESIDDYLNKDVDKDISYFRLQTDSGVASRHQRIWVVDIGEYRTSSWVEDYCHYCTIHNEYNRYSEHVVVDIIMSPAGRSLRSRPTTRMGRQRIQSETYTSIDGYRYHNRIPYVEINGHKIPKVLEKLYINSYNLVPEKVVANG